MCISSEESERTKTENMIVKIPIYFELDEALSPQEVADATDKIQFLFTKDLMSEYGEDFEWKVSKRSLKAKLLHRSDVISRVT